MASRRGRLAARDRMWAGTELAIMTHPLALPPTADLRAAATLIATDFPAARLLQRLNRPSGRWVDSGEAPADAGRQCVVVHDGPGPAELGVGAFVGEMQRHRCPERPTRWVAAADALTVLIDHAVGDGLTATTMARLLVDTATRGSLPDWARPETAKRPLLSAMLNHYGRHPSLALKTLSEARPGLSRRSVGNSEPFTPVMGLVHGKCQKQRLRELQVWRRRHAPGSSMTVLHACLVRGALAAVGLPPDGGPTVLVDARRYLRPGEVVSGNFVVGLELPGRKGWDPIEMTAALDRALKIGRPLGALAYVIATQQARAVMLALPFTSAGVTQTPMRPVDPRPVLAVTSMGSPHLDRLPWLGSPTLASLSTPAPAGGITVGFVQLRESLNFSFSFFGSVYDRSLIEEAARAISEDPVALLGASPGG